MEKMIREIRDTMIELVCDMRETRKDTDDNKVEIKELKKDLWYVRMKVYTLCAGGSILFGVAVWVFRSKVI